MNSTAKAIIYFLVLTLSFPVVFVLLVLPSLFISAITRVSQYLQSQRKIKESKQLRKTVLVTGAPHTKGLQVGIKNCSKDCFIIVEISISEDTSSSHLIVIHFRFVDFLQVLVTVSY